MRIIAVVFCRVCPLRLFSCLTNWTHWCTKMQRRIPDSDVDNFPDWCPLPKAEEDKSDER